MRELLEVTAVRPDRKSLVWFQHVVRPLLRPPGAVGAAHADCARGHAGSDRAQAGTPRALGCFAGPEGVGCDLSPDEQRIGRVVRDLPMSWAVR